MTPPKPKEALLTPAQKAEQRTLYANRYETRIPAAPRPRKSSRTRYVIKQSAITKPCSPAS